MLVEITPDDASKFDGYPSREAHAVVPNETIVFLLSAAIIVCAGLMLSLVAAALHLTDGTVHLHGYIVDPFPAYDVAPEIRVS